jgi:hypothetical protein
MRKADTTRIRKDFKTAIDHVATAIDEVSKTGVPTRTKKLVAESSFLAAVVLWESFVSELILGLVNRDSATFTATVQKQMREHAEKKFGKSMAASLTLALPKHLKAAQVRALIDQKDLNVSFASAADMVSRSQEWLHPTYAAYFAALLPADLAIIDACRAIRNYSAHRSRGAGTKLNTALADKSLPATLKLKTKTKRDVGKYLTAIPSKGKLPRVATLLAALQRLASAIQP